MEVVKKEDMVDKHIKYKSMFFNNVNITPELEKVDTISNLDIYLQNEKSGCSNEPWGKLNKSLKIQKIQDYVNRYAEKNSFNEDETNALFTFLIDCINRKKLTRVKDVIYDKESGVVKDIPALTYVKSNKHFTLKNIDTKRISTLKSLGSKKQGTIRKKEESESDEN